MKRTLAMVLFFIMSASTVFAAPAMSLGDPKVLEQVAVRAEAGNPILLAQAEPGTQQQEQKPQAAKHSWSNFWEVHFGGYRWIWWAVAAGGLIAIHAGN